MDLLPVGVVHKGEVHHADIGKPDGEHDPAQSRPGSLPIDGRVLIAASIVAIVE